MNLSTAKPFLLFAVAILFGMIQVLCVCSIANAASPTASTPMDHEVQHGFGFANSVLIAQDDISPDNLGSEHHGGHDDHAGDCAHCSNTSTINLASDVLSPALILSVGDKGVPPIRTPQLYALPSLATINARVRLRWRAPPSPTPVLLKTRLTI